MMIAMPGPPDHNTKKGVLDGTLAPAYSYTLATTTRSLHYQFYGSVDG